MDLLIKITAKNKEAVLESFNEDFPELQTVLNDDELVISKYEDAEPMTKINVFKTFIGNEHLFDIDMLFTTNFQYLLFTKMLKHINHG